MQKAFVADACAQLSDSNKGGKSKNILKLTNRPLAHLRQSAKEQVG